VAKKNRNRITDDAVTNEEREVRIGEVMERANRLAEQAARLKAEATRLKKQPKRRKRVDR
jgi:hypothetical protein